jgi:hypothetical protein
MRMPLPYISEDDQVLRAALLRFDVSGLQEDAKPAISVVSANSFLWEWVSKAGK